MNSNSLIHHLKTVVIDFECLHQKRRSLGDMSLQPPKPTILKFLEKISEFYGVYIYSKKKKENIVNWLTENKMDEFVVDVISKKPERCTLFFR